MWINDTVNMDRELSITATLSSGTYTLKAQTSGLTLATFGSQAGAQDALDAFLAVAGYPWIVMGSLSSVANSQDPRVIAVNVANVEQMSSVTDGEGSGLAFNTGWRSAGFSPYADAAAAKTAVLALAGSVAFP